MKNREKKVLSNQCRICGAPAEYSYFGVISCDACKTFFRRYANSSKTKFQCDFGGQCEINIINHVKCPSCRLNKCFKCGMNADKFRASISMKSKKKSLVNVQVQHQQSEIIPTLNLLQSDKSLLTQNQWRLISNLCNVYNESNLLSTGQLLFNTYYGSKSTNIVDETLMNEFLVSVYETVRTYLHLNDDLCKLSSDDRSIILHNAANNITCLTDLEKNAINIHHWADKFIDSDVVLIKLGISLFAVSQYTYLYSPNMPKDLTNPINILEIQNKYAEVTWKYLLYRYEYYEAIKRFLKLTLWFIAGCFLSYDGQKSMEHVNSVHTVVEETELKLILDDVDQIVEENK